MHRYLFFFFLNIFILLPQHLFHRLMIWFAKKCMKYVFSLLTNYVNNILYFQSQYASEHIKFVIFSLNFLFFSVRRDERSMGIPTCYWLATASGEYYFRLCSKLFIDLLKLANLFQFIKEWPKWPIRTQDSWGIKCVHALICGLIWQRIKWQLVIKPGWSGWK